GDLAAAIPIARARFEQWKALHQEYYDASTAIRDRNMIDRAKNILIRRAGITEDEAYRRMQRMSWDKNVKLAQVAEMIITAEDAFEGE
ncbi:MAG TPA: ANTAR domain-containing protein, partial [Burkholderiaceae bacterium]|nr:ANTAR domain-containing protein [Burkholderiaceae bacterium]